MLSIILPFFSFRHYHTHIHENFCTPLNHQLKVNCPEVTGKKFPLFYLSDHEFNHLQVITTSKLLGIVARERANATSNVLAKWDLSLDIHNFDLS